MKCERQQQLQVYVDLFDNILLSDTSKPKIVWRNWVSLDYRNDLQTVSVLTRPIIYIETISELSYRDGTDKSGSHLKLVKPYFFSWFTSAPIRAAEEGLWPPDQPLGPPLKRDVQKKQNIMRSVAGPTPMYTCSFESRGFSNTTNFPCRYY